MLIGVSCDSYGNLASSWLCFMFAVVVVPEAFSTTSVLIWVPPLEFGLPKAFLLTGSLCFALHSAVIHC